MFFKTTKVPIWEPASASKVALSKALFSLVLSTELLKFKLLTLNTDLNLQKF